MTASLADLLDGLRAGDAHRGGLRCARVFRVAPSAFAELRREVAELRRTRPASRVADADHVTGWTQPSGVVTQHSLYNRSGRTDDFTSDHDLSCRGKWFFDEATWPTLGRLVAGWPHLVNVRVNVLGPGARLAAHEEHVAFRTVDGRVGARLRFHLPLETSDAAVLNLDGDVYRLEAGVVHLVNHGCVHAAVNHGRSVRVHLVWDALLTEALAALLLGAVPPPCDAEACGLEPPAPLRREPVGAFRRLAPAVPLAELATMTVCDPQ